MNINLRLLYLYLFSFVGLLIVVIGSIQMVNLGLKMTVFKDADKYMAYPQMDVNGKALESEAEVQARQDKDLANQRQRELANSLSMIVIGVPLYFYHWRMIQKEGGIKG
jgi:predicted  nucleic acid-binding Zn ribbon protein